MYLSGENREKFLIGGTTPDKLLYETFLRTDTSVRVKNKQMKMEDIQGKKFYKVARLKQLVSCAGILPCKLLLLSILT